MSTCLPQVGTRGASVVQFCSCIEKREAGVWWRGQKRFHDLHDDIFSAEAYIHNEFDVDRRHSL